MWSFVSQNLFGRFNADKYKLPSKITSLVKKIYPNVFDELVYSSTSNKTEAFLGNMRDLEKERKINCQKAG